MTDGGICAGAAAVQSIHMQEDYQEKDRLLIIQQSIINLIPSLQICEKILVNR